MSAPTWIEYLSDLSRHLEVMRHAAENGAPPPELPGLPSSPIPDSCREQALRLAVEFDQLATEVRARIVAIDRRLSPVRRNPHQLFRVASYVDVSS